MENVGNPKPYRNALGIAGLQLRPATLFESDGRGPLACQSSRFKMPGV